LSIVGDVVRGVESGVEHGPINPIKNVAEGFT
jgi:hypothetical protein